MRLFWMTQKSSECSSYNTKNIGRHAQKETSHNGFSMISRILGQIYQIIGKIIGYGATPNALNC